MDLLKNIPTPLLVAAVALVGGFVGWLGRGLAFALKRWWTGSPKHEQATYLNSVADLAAKLRANGMTLEDVRALEGKMRSPSVASSGSAAQMVQELSEEAEPEAFQSNAAMKARTAAAYDVAGAKLDQALMDLQLLLHPDDQGPLAKAHEAWLQYRRSLEERAFQHFSGGTHATLAMALTGLAETERRTEEVRAEVAERANR